MVILDATEANINFNKPLIIAFYQSKLVFFDQNTGILERNLLPLSDFKIFEHNLNAF
jgi:hypothetical protein